MRDEIRQILQQYENPAEFAPPCGVISPAQNLVNIALGGLNAYSRIKGSSSRNMATDVLNLSKEMRKKYYTDPTAAKITIECVAELLGYTPPDSVQMITPPPTPAIGEKITFGDYQWLVLDTDSQNKKALILSVDITEERAYHPCYAGVTWETSMLREYLNGDFLNSFTADEQARIAVATLNNPPNLWYGTHGGNPTEDKIFILSLEEADRYFGDSGDYLNNRRKKYHEGKWIADPDGWFLSNAHDPARIAKYGGLATIWWLRTPGYSDCTTSYVSTPGNIPLNGDRVCIGRGGVRPALWILY